MSLSSRGVPQDVLQHMYDVLAQTLVQLLPPYVPPERVIKRHAWYDYPYVGLHNGRPVRWTGWSCNLRTTLKQHGAIYFDYVPNVLSREERIRLFGEPFTQAIEGMEMFVCLFITGCSIKAKQSFVERGYIVRTLDQNLHPALIQDSKSFTQSDVDHWAGRALQLIAHHKSFCH